MKEMQNLCDSHFLFFLSMGGSFSSLPIPKTPNYSLEIPKKVKEKYSNITLHHSKKKESLVPKVVYYFWFMQH